MGLFLTTAAVAESVTVEAVSARKDFDQRTGQPIVTISVREKDAISRLTSRNVGQTMEIRIDGKVLARAVLREPLLSSVFQISGREPAEADALVDRISTAGAKLEIAIVPSR